MVHSLASFVRDYAGPLIVLAGVVGLFAGVALSRLAAPAAREAACLRDALSEFEAANRRLEAKAADLAAALATAESGDRAKSQFVAAMSHRLRTQLNAIIGFAEFLGTDLCGSLTAKQRGYVGDIRRAGGYLLELISDVDDLSRVEARQLVLDDEVVDLGDLIAGAVTVAGPRAAEVGVTLRSAAAPGLPPVRADAGRLRQILVDLLSNALKFTPKGGSVTASSERRGADLALVVSDTGVGMAPERIALALARFGQPDEPSTRRPGGSGLSLPLVKRLVELHGGSLAIDSTLGRGTTVTILLPAVRILDRAAAA